MNMKKINSLFPFIIILALLFSACEKDYLILKKIEITAPVSFSTDIAPILTKDCATSGCHVTGAIAPDLTASKAYDDLIGLGYVDTTNAEGSVLYIRIIGTTRPMPPAARLTPDEIGYILAWIKQGAQNN